MSWVAEVAVERALPGSRGRHRVVSRGSHLAHMVYVMYTTLTMMPSDLVLIASLATVSRHGCLRRAAHRRGNRYIVRALDRSVKHAA